MFEIGRICLKTAGRDAGKYGIVIKQEEAQYVLIDGYTRRRKVNVKHLEPTSKLVDIKENASTEEVKKALEKAGFKEKPMRKPIKKKEEEPKKPQKKSQSSSSKQKVQKEKKQ
ncbi:MAG: large subunit ribosomal protein L14e [Candidatus Woesearchaeota archaeon]|nr:large subunit ribosomal protein L14e [Candidatus Woesearchaeota archaeon]